MSCSPSELGVPLKSRETEAQSDEANPKVDHPANCRQGLTVRPTPHPPEPTVSHYVTWGPLCLHQLIPCTILAQDSTHMCYCNEVRAVRVPPLISTHAGPYFPRVHPNSSRRQRATARRGEGIPGKSVSPSSVNHQ